MCRFVGTAPGIFGLASSALGADLGPKSTNFGRILKICQSLFPLSRDKGPRLAGDGCGVDPEPRKTRPHPSTQIGGLCTGLTLGFLIHGFWAGLKSLILGVWADPGGPQKPFEKVGGFAPTL